ncbi:MAG: 16S rRNA (uracil(1498)-N(3))-methyltransferase [Acidimicrobiia bacterium]|nr:16S rRNA (uracil(1498)-N(3))-methyltransferase [Acidimicrobiia bacterium]
MDERLRRSAAHVLVADLGAPVLDEAVDHHLRRVLRLRPGDPVTVTDGAGGWRPCRLVADGLAPDGEPEHELPPDPPVMVAAAPPKGERAEWLVQKCVEVGVDHLVLVVAERSVVRWDGDRAVRHLDRLRRIAGEAAAQSRRVWWPTVEGPVPAADVLPAGVVAEPGGRSIGPEDHLVAVGPEGGWTEHEVAISGGSVSLGPTVLRVETAAVVATALMVATRDRATA